MSNQIVTLGQQISRIETSLLQSQRIRRQAENVGDQETIDMTNSDIKEFEAVIATLTWVKQFRQFVILP